MTQVKTGYAPLNGAQLYYEVAGAGEPLVFIHAGIADHRMWQHQFDAFAQHYRVVRYDMRGYGNSALPDADYSHRRDLAVLLDHLGIERARVVGCSMGGSTAIDFTLAYPERVEKLVTVCSSPHGFKSSAPLPPIWDEIVAASDAGDVDKTCALEVQLWVVGLYRQPDEVDVLVRNLAYLMNHTALKNEMAHPDLENEVLDPRAVTRLEEIRVPMLVVVGELDRPSVQEAAGVMMSRIPSARRLDIANTAHLPSLERPDVFNPAVLAFLAE